MDLGLRGKTALVAGASQGLGRAIANALAAEGASLILCSRTAATLEDACESIRREFAGEVLGVAGDLSVRSDIDNIVNSAIGRFGKIDILVTNTGGPPAGRFEDQSREAWDAAVTGLLTSVLDLTRLVVPGMKERRWGRILNVTSIAAKQPVDNLMLSNSIRAAVTGFAKTLANEVAEFGITVNNIMPGYTRTERLDELIEFLAKKDGLSNSEVTARWEAEIPARRLGDPAEFGQVAAFLVSEPASYITGSSIAVDGGWIKSLF